MASLILLHTKLNENGRIVIPAAIRQQLGFKPCDDLVLVIEEDELRVTTMLKRAQRAQRIVKTYAPSENSVADELIADRRREALLE